MRGAYLVIFAVILIVYVACVARTVLKAVQDANARDEERAHARERQERAERFRARCTADHERQQRQLHV